MNETELLERAGALAEIFAAFDRVASGTGGVVVVEGAAGLGKSSLVAAAAEAAAAAGITPLTARAREFERRDRKRRP